jgi:hypothetical protein
VAIAEQMIARGAEGDIGKPERQGWTEIGSDLVFPAKGQHRGKLAGRAPIQQHGQRQPQRRLQQHHQPDHQPRPGADQFDNQRGETHETSEMPNPDLRAGLVRSRRVIRWLSRRGNTAFSISRRDRASQQESAPR